MRRTSWSKIHGATAALLALALGAGGATPARAQKKDWKDIKSPKLREVAIPEPERYTLPNGLRVLLLEDHELPLVQVVARVRTGARLEPADKTGLAALTGSVLRTGGAGGRSGDEIDDFLDARGARIESSIDVDAGLATASCLKGDFPGVLALFADVLRAPAFDEAKLKVAKTQTAAGIARRNDDPMAIMQREGRRLVYGADSPYGRLTEYATLDAIVQADLRGWHAKYYVPNRVFLGVVGDFDAREIKALLEQEFGDWARGPEAQDAAAAFRATPRPGVYHVLKTDMTQSDVILGHLGIRRDSPDYFAAEVLNEVWSGSFAARLFSHIRSQKGLAYSVRGGLGSNFDYPGTFNVWLTTKTETTAAAIDAMLQEVDDLVQRPPDEDEVARAKQSMLASFVFNFATRPQILQQQLTYEYFGYPADFLSRYRDNVERVTAADVARVAKTHVKKEDLAILVVGNTAGLDRPLETFGAVTALDVAIPEPASAAAAAAAPAGMGEREAEAKGRQIVDRVLAALGGADRVDAVRNLRLGFDATQSTPRGEMQVRGTSLYVYPDRLRQEMNTPMGAITMVVTPSEAFMSGPMGVQPLPDARRGDLLRALNREPLLLFQHRADPGFKVAYAGTQKVDALDAESIAVTFGAETVRYAVDPSSGRVLRVSYRGTGPAGTPGDRESNYSDYREAGGVVFPFQTEMRFNGEPMGSMKIQQVEVNVALDEAQFAKPAAAGGG